MAKKKTSRKHPQLDEFAKLLETFCELTDAELCPSEDICLHAAKCRERLSRDAGRPPKQNRIDLILYYSGQGLTVKQIVEQTKIPETTVRRHYRRKEEK